MNKFAKLFSNSYLSKLDLWLLPRRTLLTANTKNGWAFFPRIVNERKIKNDEKFFPRGVVGSAESWMERKGAKMRKGEWNIKNWEPFMLNLFFMLGLPEIFLPFGGGRSWWRKSRSPSRSPAFVRKCFLLLDLFFSTLFFEKEKHIESFFIT